MVNGLHLCCTFLTSGHSKRFTIWPHIHRFIQTIIHRWRCRRCHCEAGSRGVVSLVGAQPFVVWTDHRNLEYIQSANRLNSRQARWGMFFGQFDFTLNYRPMHCPDYTPLTSTRRCRPHPAIYLPSRPPCLGDRNHSDSGQETSNQPRNQVTQTSFCLGLCPLQGPALGPLQPTHLSPRHHSYTSFPTPVVLVAHHGPRHSLQPAPPVLGTRLPLGTSPAFSTLCTFLVSRGLCYQSPQL